jgi:hypothetical protein
LFAWFSGESLDVGRRGDFSVGTVLLITNVIKNKKRVHIVADCPEIIVICRWVRECRKQLEVSANKLLSDFAIEEFEGINPCSGFATGLFVVRV